MCCRRARTAASAVFGSERLAPTTTAVALTAVIALTVGLSSQATPVTVQAEGVGEVSATLPLVATPMGGVVTDEVVSPVETRIRVPGERVLDLMPGVVWKLSVVAPGFHAAERSFYLDNAGSAPVRVQVWRTGEVEGRLPLDAELGGLAGLVEGVGVANRGKTRLPPTEVQCRVGSRTWSCEVPATTLDLWLHVPGHATELMFGVEVPPGRTVDLGLLDPVPGASILGEIERPPETESDAAQAPEVVLRLARSGESDEELQRVRPHPRRGLFQFKGLQPGSYALGGRHPHWVAGTVEPVIVHPGRETRLRLPLVFGPPLSLSVTVSPSEDPLARPWFFSLSKVSRIGFEEQRIVNSAALYQGNWSRDDLPPGDYRLRIRDSNDSAWYTEMVELKEDREVWVDLDWRRLEGRVSLGGQPLEAEIWFGGRRGGHRFGFESDKEGRFSGYLPRAGPWRVDVEGDSVHRSLRQFEVAEAGSSSVLRAEIELPSTRIRGVVVDPRGEAVGPAIVIARSLSDDRTPLSFRTERNGSFILDGLPPGEALLRAEALARRQSDDWVRVELHEQRETEVELVVWPDQVLEGRLVSGSGAAIVGGQVMAYPASSRASLIAIDRTDLDGRFELRVDAGGEEMAIIVMALGFPMRTLRAPVESFPLEVRMGGPGGSVELVGEGLMSGDLAVFHEGVGFGGPHLANWATLQGGEVDGHGMRLRAPGMPPGDYAACHLTVTELADSDATLPKQRCAFGTLLPFGELVLDVPPPERAVVTSR